MTWILPKQLHTLACALDTEALSLDLAEQSQICAQSLFVRSKHSPLRTWSQKWKRDSWTALLSGRILKPSHTSSFTDEWTSSLEATHVNHSARQGSEQDQTTQDTFGLSSQTEFDLCDPRCASLRTSKDTSRWDSPASSATWKNWVTKRRGEYSARLNAVRHTNGSVSSSWPTASSRDWKDSAGMATSSINKDGSDRNRIDQLPRAVFHDHGRSLVGQQTATRMTSARSADLSMQKNASALAQRRMESSMKNLMESCTDDQNNFGPVALDSPSTDGSRPESWATPTARDFKSGRGKEDRDYKELTPMVERTQIWKLNPRWVETLMGLPVGWTLPSCTQPVTIAQTNCDCSETELSQPPQSEPLELF